MTSFTSPQPCPWNVLIVEEDADTSKRCSHAISTHITTSGRELARLSVARTVADARVQLLRAERLDLVLLDLALPDGWGHELIPLLRSRFPEVELIVHSTFEDDANLFRALALGASGYILKTTDEAEFLRLLAELDRGRPALSTTVARRLLRTFRDAGPQPEPPLTPKEFEVVQFLARGLTNAETASCLGISAHTVSSHVKSIYRKLQVSTRAEMTGLAQRSGWVSEMTS